MIVFLLLVCLSWGAIGGDISQVTGNGELAQFEYAGKAVLRSRDYALSYIDPMQNSAVALSVCKVNSPLMKKFENTINQYASSKIASLIVGYPPDCHLLSKSINEFIQDYVQIYGDEPFLVYLSNKVSDLMTSGMYKSGDSQLTRPLAACCLLHQFDASKRQSHLYQVDSSGLVTDRLYSIFGDFNPTAYKSIESTIKQIQNHRNDQQKTTHSGLIELFDAVCESGGDDDQLYNVEVCSVSEKGVKRWSANSIDKTYFKNTDNALTLKNLVSK